MRLDAFTIVLFTACLGTALAQAPSQQRRTLTGTVVDSVTGEPIRRALVHVNGIGSFSAFTGLDGRFEIPSVPEGQLFLDAQKPGFFGSTHAPVAFTLGPSTGDVVVKLLPEAKIRGHVVDRTGEPIEFLNIQLLAYVIVNGRREWQGRRTVTTDDDGSYLMENLEPGKYALHTQSLVSGPAESTSGKSNNRLEVFPPTYYPDASDRSSLQAVDVNAGQDLTIDLTLASVPGYRVSGTAIGGPARVICEDVDGQPLTYAIRFDARTGEFVLDGIPPGSWMLRAVAQNPEQNSEAEQPIEVTSSDLAGVVLQLQPLVSIPVHLLNLPSAGAPGVLVHLTRIKANPMREYASSQRPGDPPDSLTIRDVPSGSYRVLAQVFNAGCVASVTSGTSDLTSQELNISPGSQPAPIDVTLRSDCGSISATLPYNADHPTISSVILVSDSSLRDPLVYRAGGGNTARFQNLTPGTYRLYAFDDLSDLEYANPEALRGFSAQAVTVGPNEKSNVQLDLIMRAK